MTNPIIKIVNVETGEEVERPMNAAENKQLKLDTELALSEIEALEAKSAARQSALEKLAALGLTQAEIQALTA